MSPPSLPRVVPTATLEARRALRRCLVDDGHAHNNLARLHQNGTPLYASDGTPGGTAPIAVNVDIITDHVFGFEGTAYLSASGPGGAGQELWRSDGTLAGTELVADLVPGASGLVPNYFAARADDFFFHACGLGCGLWISDGTAQGTTEVDGDATLGELPLFAVAGDTYYFPADANGVEGVSLWRSDEHCGRDEPDPRRGAGVPRPIRRSRCRRR
jgi:ELWxxDGT repeat protein